MSTATLQHRSRLLLEHCLDQKGVLQADQAMKVVKAVGNSDISDKMPLLRQLVHLIDQLERQQRAVVTMAGGLAKATMSEIEKWITEHNPTIRSIDYIEDSSLLGGLTIQAGDAWYDVSVKHKLTMIEEQLG